MSVADAFDATAQSYDRSRRQLIPRFDDFYGVALEQARFDEHADLRVLDLGAGTGLMSAFFAQRFPNASFVLVDVAAAMLQLARERFSGDPGRFTFAVRDYSEALPSGRFDLVISALSIHHLAHEAKRALFARVHAALREGGRFINADQVLGPTPKIEAQYRQAWLDGARSLGATERDLAEAQERMRHDITAPLADQLGWLSEAGFVDVDCPYKHHMFAVMTGRTGPV